MADQPTTDLGKTIQEVSEKASLLIREEIELAKAEVTQKMTRLVKGAAVGIAAGIFAVTGLLYLLHALAWFLFKLFRNDSADNVWLGYIIVAGALFVLGGLAGFLAARLIKRGAPPTPRMAIEEGKLIKETVTSHHGTEVQR
jgi:protein-S-isoprenylcysteine O-methyltransferase Ste14